MPYMHTGTYWAPSMHTVMLCKSSHIEKIAAAAVKVGPLELGKVYSAPLVTLNESASSSGGGRRIQVSLELIVQLGMYCYAAAV